MTRFKRSSKWFEIAEEPIPVHAWKPEDGLDHLRVIEQDIHKLMRQLAEAKFLLSEQQRQHTDKAKRFLLAIVEVMDAFERVFRSIHAKEDQVTPQMRIWIDNFRAVHGLLDDLLSEYGVVKIENLTQGFDPHWHTAAEVVVDPSRSDRAIVEEVKKGYMWQGQVLRKSEVVVVRNSEKDAEKTDYKGVLASADGVAAGKSGATDAPDHRNSDA